MSSNEEKRRTWRDSAVVADIGISWFVGLVLIYVISVFTTGITWRQTHLLAAAWIFSILGTVVILTVHEWIKTRILEWSQW